MSLTTKHIYEQHIRPLSRERRVKLLRLLRAELENGTSNAERADHEKQVSLIERHVAESRRQIAKGRAFGPLSTAEEAVETLTKNAKSKLTIQSANELAHSKFIV